MNRKALLGSTVAALVLVAGEIAYAAAERLPDDPHARSLTGENPVAGAPVVQGGAGGVSWSLLGLTSDDDRGRVEGQGATLGYDNTDITIRGKWDNRYKARGGFTFGSTLDEQKHHAIGGGFLTNERASEFYGQYQFVAPDLDPLSSFTLGEYASRENQFFTTGGQQVWGYTTYLNWFKRSDGRQSPDGDLPPALRSGIQTLLDNVSALSGTAAYTYMPIVRQDSEGSPRTNALDLSLRGVTPAPFGSYFPVSVGIGVNVAHYHHVDDTTQTKAVGNGGMGLAFMGGDYFRQPIHWLVGVGGDGDTRGVAGGTVAAELGPISVSYRQTSDHQATVLVGWRISDLWSDTDRQRASTLNVADGRAPLSFASADYGAGLPDRIAHAENSLLRAGFMPPMGGEVVRPPSSPGSTGTASLQLSPASVAQQPLQVQQAVKRTQELQQQVTTQKNADVRSSGGGKTVFVGLTPSNNMAYYGADEIWGTATSIKNPNGSSFYAISSDGVTMRVWIVGNTVHVDLSHHGCSTATVATLYQDGINIGTSSTIAAGGGGGC